MTLSSAVSVEWCNIIFFIFVKLLLKYCAFLKVEHMKMNSSVLSAKDFFQLVVNSLLELCTHCIDGRHIISIEGNLMLTLDTGDKVALNILQQNVNSLLNSVEDVDKSSSVCYLLYMYILSLIHI